MTFDDKMIYAYQWTDGADSVGIKGPSGDNYLYAHYQFDTQASYRLPGGFQVYAYGLNLNNEVFGFYNGSPSMLFSASTTTRVMRVVSAGRHTANNSFLRTTYCEPAQHRST
jgi:hypothetical protein